jgi:hypothetical protein
VWAKNKKSDNSRKPDNKTLQTSRANSEEAERGDLYEGWQDYSNAMYGISFKYPVDWRIVEGAFNSPNSATSQEYAINVKREEEVKYNETISIEVLGEGLEEVAQWYANYFAQSPSNKVNRTTGQLKGRQSVQYTVTHTDGETKLYLFDLDNRTYLFTSVHEWLTLQTDPNYWTKFDKIFASLEISPAN